MNFDLDDVRTKGFGVGRSVGDDTFFYTVAVDNHVQDALLRMASKTWEQMWDFGEAKAYSPAEKHGSKEYLVVRADDPFELALRQLHDTPHLTFDTSLLRDPQGATSYFARFTDGKGRQLTAIRRASYFKGVLKKKLLKWYNDDTLKIVDDDVFKLDDDFDVLVDSECSHILRPRAFEALCRLEEAVRRAVPDNVREIASKLPFVDLDSIKSYAMSHSRAARCIASIRSQNLTQMDRQALLNLCSNTGVGVSSEDGLIAVRAGSEIAFLEVLDRRRYQVELVPDQPERFRASSRSQIGR